MDWTAVSAIAGAVVAATSLLSLRKNVRRVAARVDYLNEALTGMYAVNPDPILVVEMESQEIVYANPQAHRVLGWPHDAPLMGQSLCNLIPERLRRQHEFHVKAFARAPASRAMGPNRVLTARCFDGSERRVQIELAPLRNGLVIAHLHFSDE